jgi:ABC-type dipeptide/oligopeptide/nickel transport system permease subunit
MVVVLVEFTNAQTPIAQTAWMVVVEVTGAFMELIIAESILQFTSFKVQINQANWGY